MKYSLYLLLMVMPCFAINAQRLSAKGMVKLAYTHSIYTADTTIEAMGHAKPPTSVYGVYPMVYDMINWNPDSLKFPNRYEVSKWSTKTDSTLAITFVTSDTLQFNKLIDEFVAEKFVRTAYGEKSINKDYTSVKYPNIVMRVSYNQLLDMGPNKIGVFYTWR